MTFIEEIIILVKARYPIIYITSSEEERLEYTIRKTIKNFDNRIIYCWNYIDGFSNNSNNYFAARNPIQALELIENFTSDIPSIFILKDFDKFLTDIVISRKLKNLIKIFKNQSKTIIIFSENINIPVELVDLIPVIKFKLPTKREIEKEVKRLFIVINKPINKNFNELLIRSCQGLSMERIRRTLLKSIAQFSDINEKTIELILREKKQIINQTQILKYETSSITFKDIGGLKNLKLWIFNRASTFNEKAKLYGLPTPRGLLITGIQGTGKSLIVKAIANDWQVPLLSLDIGKIFGELVGESEKNVREMINIVESLAPCILWMDEIDKTFTLQNNRDNGTTNRVFATLITWLAEKTAPVFIIATANNFNLLPLELIRKGRFDEIFFINLPNFEERKQIFEIFLYQLRPETLNLFDISQLSKKAEGFSGAEIKQAIIEGMHNAFNEKREFNTQDIVNGLKEIIPLSEIEPMEILELQNWALSGRIRLAS